MSTLSHWSMMYNALYYTVLEFSNPIGHIDYFLITARLIFLASRHITAYSTLMHSFKSSIVSIVTTHSQGLVWLTLYSNLIRNRLCCYLTTSYTVWIKTPNMVKPYVSLVLIMQKEINIWIDILLCYKRNKREIMENYKLWKPCGFIIQPFVEYFSVITLFWFW